MEPLLLFFLAWAVSVDCFLPQNQTDSLNALYSSTGGPLWGVGVNWNTSVDPCTAPWYGVFCDAANETVVCILLPDNKLNGSLPDLQLPSLRIM